MIKVLAEQDARDYIMRAVDGCGYTISADAASAVAGRLREDHGTWDMSLIPHADFWSLVQDGLNESESARR